MKIEREVLLSFLRRLRPALADKSPVEGITQIWFSGETATAFNDVIGIMVECPETITGGVHGGTLLGMLEASTAKEIEVGVNNKDGETMSLTGPGVRAYLPVIPGRSPVFTFPEVKGKGVSVDDALSDALKHAAVALASSADNKGVTFSVEGDTLAVYATDGMVIAWTRIAKPKAFTGKRLVLSPAFCDQVSALGENASLHFLDDGVVGIGDAARLFGRLVETKELDFLGTIKTNVGAAKNAVDIPEKLRSALDRAEVLVSVQRSPIEMSVKQGVLRLHLKTDLGELSEAIKLSGKHPDAEGLFNGSLVVRGLSRCKKFVLSEQCFAMLGEGDSGFLVAASV